MPTPELEAFDSEIKILDRAMESQRGIQLWFTSKGAAYQYRLRLYQARHADKNRNKKIYPVDDDLYGHTAYEALTMPQPLEVEKEIEGGEIQTRWCLRIIKRGEIEAGIFVPQDLEKIEDI